MDRTAHRQPGPGHIRVKVTASGVCRTDLHVVDGELLHPQVPIIPGHEIVGWIDAIGPAVEGLTMGERVGIPWLGHTCGIRPYCRMHRENLCDQPIFTGYTRDGGYATATIADARFAFPLGEAGSDTSLAPLLCAGLIGWRSLVIADDGKRPGLYGFGAAAHVIAQSQDGRGDPYLPSPGLETLQRRPSRGLSAPFGRAAPTRCRRSRPMPRSSSRPSAIWFPWR